MGLNHNKIISRLKEFYVLEKFQVAYYKAQLSCADDEYYRTAFKKMVQIEDSHANFFANKLTEKNINLPVVSGSLFELAGSILGETVEITGPQNTCKLGVILETKAIEMYKKFIIEAWEDESLRKTLWEYLLDEEFHTFWMQDYLKHIKKI